jgi:hypothetical protein
MSSPLTAFIYLKIIIYLVRQAPAPSPIFIGVLRLLTVSKSGERGDFIK